MAFGQKRGIDLKKLLVLFFMAALVSSCGLFQRSKKSAAVKISTVAQGMAIKHLGCETGDAVKEDVQEKLEKLFKVQDEGTVAGASSDPKSLWGSVCAMSVKTILPFLVNFSSNKLPDSWVDDGCSFKTTGDLVEDLALQLCNEI